MKRVVTAYMGQSLVCAGLLLVAGCASSRFGGGGIDGEAKKVLKNVGAYLGEQDALSYKAVGLLDVRQEDGRLAQTSEEFVVHMQRPNRLKIDAILPGRTLTLWYDAGRVVVLNDKKQVAHATASDDLDTFLDELTQKYGASFPGQDLLRRKPGAALKTEATHGTYVGLETHDGQALHHLAFLQGSAAWEIWVDADESPLPRRFTMVELDQAGRPRYEVDFMEWNAAAVSRSMFIPELPPGAKPVSIETLTDAMEVK